MNYKIHLLFIFTCISLTIMTMVQGTQRSEMLNNMIDTEWLYTEDGNLTIMQHNLEGNSEEVKLFFKGKLSKCDQERKKNGIYFDILVCIPKDSDCPKGLKICYESSLNSDHLNDKTKHLMENKNNEQQCLDGIYDHSLYINISRKDQMATAYIVSSIDEIAYKVDLPQPIKDDIMQCFKIRVGTEDSIQTQITELNGNKLKVVPSLQEKIENDLVEKGWKNREKNFNLFSLDFIPKLNKWRQNYGDYYKTFTYHGSDEMCSMSMQFVGEKVHRCSYKWVDTGLNCQGPLYSKGMNKSNECRMDPNDNKKTIVEGDEKINICEFEITYQTGDTQTKIMRDITSSGYINEKEKFSKITFFPYAISSILRRTSYSKKIYNTENVNLIEDGTIESDTKITKKMKTWKLFVSTGCEIISQELFVNCNGYDIKTKRYRFQARPIEKLP